mgnify:CR=1 FL=1|tara:strand:+ start:19639 stop:21090 length:1452 start_codon:yes stop_codon:yes gene_type:complete
MIENNKINYNALLIKNPTVVNLEITEICNVKCKHCYNPWRDESMGINFFSKIKLTKVIKNLKNNKIFHVILSGGEPFSNFAVLTEALKQLNEANISFSCNTNLILADDKKIKKLASLGLDHCLTSIPSINEKENDEIMQSKNSLKKIIDGIKCCIRNGVRVSANMVVTKDNKHRVFETGKLMAELGCSKFFVTRAVPPVYSEISKNNENKENTLVLSKEEVKNSLDDALKVKEKYGISIGSLISYPLCFLGDLQKYRDFVGRGCPSQRGHVININANGDIHTCVHEEETYGNIFKTPLNEIYNDKMKKWRDGSLHYKECKGCDYLNICNSGCQMTANAVNGQLASKDPLFVGKDGITNDINLVLDKKIYDYIENDGTFYVPERVRFRDDETIYVANPRWGNMVGLPHDLGLQLEKFKKSKIYFSANDIKINKNKNDWIANLFSKDIIESKIDLKIKKTITGLSADLLYLPKLNKNINEEEATT